MFEGRYLKAAVDAIPDITDIDNDISIRAILSLSEDFNKTPGSILTSFVRAELIDLDRAIKLQKMLKQIGKYL